MPRVLITANVFHNGLSERADSHEYYTKNLIRLASLPEEWQWYVTSMDYDLAFVLPAVHTLLGSPAYYHACDQLRNRLNRPLSIDQSIDQSASSFGFPNYFDALRLACALDGCLDMIVTWEPHHFSRNQGDVFRVREQGYFDYTIPTHNLEDNSIHEQTIQIFGVESLLRYADQPTYRSRSEQILLTPQFKLGRVKIQSVSEPEPNFLQINLPSTVTAVVHLATGDPVETTAQGRTPVEALYQAIDQCVDSFGQIPTRHLIYYWVPGQMGGAAAAVEVMICIQCGKETYEASATNPSIIRAFGDAYISAINQIWHTLA